MNDVPITTEEQARAAERPHVSHWTKAPHDPSRCCATVYGPRVTFWQCQRGPKVWYGSLGYCKQHDPEAARLREVQRRRQWAAEGERRDARRRLLEAEKQFQLKCVEAVQKIAAGHNDPRGLCIEIMEMKP